MIISQPTTLKTGTPTARVALVLDRSPAKRHSADISENFRKLRNAFAAFCNEASKFKTAPRGEKTGTAMAQFKQTQI